jgi:hypothetical protein
LDVSDRIVRDRGIHGRPATFIGFVLGVTLGKAPLAMNDFDRVRRVDLRAPIASGGRQRSR